MKIRPVGAEMFQADGRIDITKLIVALRSYWNVPKSENILHYTSSTAGPSGRSPAEIVGSNSTGGVEVCLL